MTSLNEETSQEQDLEHLFRAIRKGKAHLTRFMLAASNFTLLDRCNTEGRTPLIECCYIKEETTRGNMVRILNEAGANVNMKDKNGKTALIHACEQRCNDVVRTLIQHASISPDVEDTDGNTALIHSAYTGNDVALELLVRSFRRLGLNVDHYNNAGYTALHVAASNGFLQCARVLAVKGRASLALKDKVHQMTPLEWCLSLGYQKSDADFLKPSAKFYRVAKLTTAMAKYKKKPKQDGLSCSQDVNGTVTSQPPDKPKSIVRDLLRKYKAQSRLEADVGAGDAGHISRLPLTENQPEEKKLMSKFLKSSKSRFTIKSDKRSTLNKSPVLRSLSQSDKKDGTHSVQQTQAGLPHSKTHPTTDKDLLKREASESIMNVETRCQFARQDTITLPDEYGECDTDDLETFNPCTGSVFLPSDVSHNKDGNFADNVEPILGDIPNISTHASRASNEKERSSDDNIGCGNQSNSDNTAIKHTLTSETESLQNIVGMESVFQKSDLCSDGTGNTPGFNSSREICVTLNDATREAEKQISIQTEKQLPIEKQLSVQSEKQISIQTEKQLPIEKQLSVQSEKQLSTQSLTHTLTSTLITDTDRQTAGTKIPITRLSDVDQLFVLANDKVQNIDHINDFCKISPNMHLNSATEDVVKELTEISKCADSSRERYNLSKSCETISRYQAELHKSNVNAESVHNDGKCDVIGKILASPRVPDNPPSCLFSSDPCDSTEASAGKSLFLVEEKGRAKHSETDGLYHTDANNSTCLKEEPRTKSPQKVHLSLDNHGTGPLWNLRCESTPALSELEHVDVSSPMTSPESNNNEPYTGSRNNKGGIHGQKLKDFCDTPDCLLAMRKSFHKVSDNIKDLVDEVRNHSFDVEMNSDTQFDRDKGCVVHVRPNYNPGSSDSSIEDLIVDGLEKELTLFSV